MNKVEHVYIVTSDDDGICAFHDPVQKTWMPLITADENKLEEFKFFAHVLANNSKRKVYISRFIHQEIIETIKPTD